MKIYEIGTGYTPIPARMGAATEIVVEELVKSFQSLGQNVELIDIETRDRLPNSLPISQVRVPALFTDTDVKLGIMHKLKRVVYSVSLASKLKKILRQTNEPVLLHFHNQYNLYFFLKLVSPALRSKARIAYTVHSYIWHGQWELICEDVKKRYFQEIFCLRHADHIFVLNQKTMDNITAHLNVDAGKITLIDNGVNTSVYYPVSDKQKAALLEKYGLAEKKVFIQVGSVCPRKNQLGALQLLLPYLQRDKNMTFCFAGGIISGEYLDEIHALAAENHVSDQVRYMGELSPGEQLNEFYNLAEAMVFPSKAEGFSLVILEAMAAGVPVFVNRALQFAFAGRCLQYENQQEFSSLMDFHIFSADNRRDLGRSIRSAVDEAYGWHKVAGDYLIQWNS